MGEAHWACEPLSCSCLFFLVLHNIYTDESFYKLFRHSPKLLFTIFTYKAIYSTYVGTLFNAMLRAVRNWRANAKLTSRSKTWKMFEMRGRPTCESLRWKLTVVSKKIKNTQFYFNLATVKTATLQPSLLVLLAGRNKLGEGLDYES